MLRKSDTGTARRYLEETFPTLPSASDEQLKNGHVLHLYLQNKRSQAATLRGLANANFTSKSGQFLKKADIQRVLRRTIHKYRRLTHPAEFNRFAAICNDEFPGVYSPVYEIVIKSEPDSPEPKKHVPYQNGTAGPNATTPLKSPSDHVSEITVKSEPEQHVPYQSGSAGPNATTPLNFPSDLVSGIVIKSEPEEHVPYQNGTAGPNATTPLNCPSDLVSGIIMKSEPEEHVPYQSGTADPNSSIPFKSPLHSFTHTFYSPSYSVTSTFSPLLDCASSVSRRPTRSHSRTPTPSEEKLRRRLEYVTQSSVKQKKRLQVKIKDLKKKLSTPKKVINQEIKRKIDIIKKREETIRQLKRQFQESFQNRELVKLKKAYAGHLSRCRLRRRLERLDTVSAKKHGQLLEVLKEKFITIGELQYENLELSMCLDDIELEKSGENIGTKVDGKIYSSATRIDVFQCLVNKVPTLNIPPLIQHINKRLGRDQENVPRRATVELMARELGAISELQAAETIITTENVTLGFDATTQEGVHINSIHFTTKEHTVVAAVDELPGGTGSDYAAHIIQTVDNLAETYCHFNGGEIQDIKQMIIGNITNTMTDRCAANGAAIREVGEAWHKSLNQLNCHLHPLDSIATCVQSTLKKVEEQKGEKGWCLGQNSIAGNVVVKVNCLRYKDGKGDPRGFKAFLDKKQLRRGVIPRYRGNRLHIIFHTCGVFVEHYDTLYEYFKSGGGLGELQSAVAADFCNKTAQTEFVVFGLLGKMLTGPWMTKFYTAANAEVDHIEGIEVVRKVVDTLEESLKNPAELLSSPVDLFGQALSDTDSALLKLRSFPVDEELYVLMMTECLSAIVSVLKRQYSKYFALDLTEQLRRETESARAHNIDAEEVMGMFSAMKGQRPNATLDFLSCRMRAIKNKTLQYLESMEESRRENIMKMAIALGRRKRDDRREDQKELRMVVMERQDKKIKADEVIVREQMEKTLKQDGLEEAVKHFPVVQKDLNRETVAGLLEGGMVGRNILHVWSLDGELKTYNGRIERFLKSEKDGKENMYEIAYWSEDDEYNDAQDTQLSVYAVVTDLLLGDLVLIG